MCYRNWCLYLFCLMNKTLIEKIKSSFKAEFKTSPILVFAPGRINLIGEHTDYNDGFVFPAAIDRGIVTAVQKSNSKHCTMLAVDKNEKNTFLINDIQPIENGGWRNYILGVISEIQKKGIPLEPIDIAFGGDIPVGAGMSSSAALENSLVYCLNELFNLGLSKLEMILISQNAEHNYVGVKCGIMDQYTSMFGQENSALLLDCRSVESIPYQIDFSEYQLLLINTNVKHNLSDSAYNERRSVCEKIAKLLEIPSLRDASENDLSKIKDIISVDDYQKGLYVIQENERVLKASKAIQNNDLRRLGKLLYDSHSGLQKQYKVSCDELDFLVEKAKGYPDVLGARMMGGGFGGCTINIILKNAVTKFQKEVSEAYKTRFNNDCSIYAVSLSSGAQII